MKKLFLFLFALLPFFLNAEIVSEHQAQVIAEQFFAANLHSEQQTLSQTPAPSLQMVFNGENRQTSDAAEYLSRQKASDAQSQAPAYYVFNNQSGPGFVIVSGDDRTNSPVIGYSFDHNFDADSMPDNLRLWLSGLRSQINEARADNRISKNRISNKRISENATPYFHNAKEPIKLLSTPLWDQRAPFSNKLPLGFVTGCPATAIAIIMRYHQWPEAGVGVIPESNEQIGSVSLGHKYDWANMPYGYTGANDYQKDQVATLMRDVGAMVRTQYGQGSAGANPEETLPQLMPIYMRYDKSTIKSLFKKNFSDDEWHAIMRKELDENRPVLYGGYSSGGGHQFVIDGYAADNFYHVNWGWSGVSNGYYLLTTMNPPEQGAGGSMSQDGFTRKQDAIIGIQPDPNNPGGGHFDRIAYKPVGENNPFGIFSHATEYTQGVQFKVVIRDYQNKGSQTFKGQIAIAHYSAEGTFKGIICKKITDYSRYPQHISDFTENTYDCTISQPVEPGDYICGVFKFENPADWTPIRNGYLDRTDCVEQIVIMEPAVQPEPEPEPEEIFHNVELLISAGGYAEYADSLYRDGLHNLQVKDNETLSIRVVADQFSQLQSVLFNDENVTSRLVGGIYQSEPILEDAYVSIHFGRLVSVENTNDNITIHGTDGMLCIHGLTPSSAITVHTVDGTLISNVTAATTDLSLTLPSGRIYIVRISGRYFKVVL